MVFIVWSLGRESKAGKFGMFVLFLALALGLLGFVIKLVLVEMLQP
jgi:Na+/H+-dicarboxylate symporter